VSDRLQSYPPSMIARPLDDRALAVDAVAGGPILPAIAVPDADPIPGVTRQPSVAAASAAASAVASPRTARPVVGALPGGVGGAEVPSIFREANLTPIVMLLALVTAAGLGAGHALTPGHGKTLMAAYLVGTRGSALHALGLGLAVSISHTAGILVLAAVIVGAAGVLAPDVVVRAAPVAAAISILLIGGWMLVGEVRRRRAASGDPRDGRRHGHAHVDAGDHGHDHDASHAHADAHGHGHAHAPHAPQPGSTISWRSLFLLGLAGGLIPSTSALLILLGSIAAGRPAFGFVLVVAFGLGMAAVMTGIGLVLVAARDRVERASIGVRLVAARELVPLVASVVVLGFGVYLTAQALVGSPAL
jgi:ABC-type nickel/cobalt efflux system permease component RcnA